VTATGGSRLGTGGAAGGSSGMRGLTPQEIVLDMGIGWNLGNSFDASPNETSWGNPATTAAMVQAVKAAGFKTMRVPVTWTDHFGGAPNYTVDSAWLGRVEQVVKWVLDAGMYAVVNTHHDADEQWILFTSAVQADTTVKISALWKQVATRFKDYGDHLILETFNEPHGPVNAYTGGNAEQQTVLNAYIAAALAAIRGTGGNNAVRPVMIQPHGASPYQSGIKALTIPNDPNLIISLHTYYPTGFSLDASPTTWGTTAKDYTDMAASLDQILGWLPNRAIVIGEWGSVAADQLDSRVKHAKAYAQDVVRRGMCPIWWDNGGTDFGLLDRKANPPSWKYPTIVSALIDGAKAGAAPGAVDATMP
jgi:endoglucanase